MRFFSNSDTNDKGSEVISRRKQVQSCLRCQQDDDPICTLFRLIAHLEVKDAQQNQKFKSGIIVLTILRNTTPKFRPQLTFYFLSTEENYTNIEGKLNTLQSQPAICPSFVRILFSVLKDGYRTHLTKGEKHSKVRCLAFGLSNHSISNQQ